MTVLTVGQGILQQLGWDAEWARVCSAVAIPGQCPGRIIRTGRNAYHVETEQGQFVAAIGGRLGFSAEGRIDLPAVGDWVLVQPPGDGVRAAIRNLLPRRTKVLRQSVGNRKRSDSRTEMRSDDQVLAANVDVLAIVLGLDRDFNLRRLERYLAMVRASGARPLIVLNKSDMVSDGILREQRVAAVAGNAEILRISALNSSDVARIRKCLRPGETMAVLGSSGVGKSTLVNGLIGWDRQRTAAVSESINKGRHTTTERELMIVPSGGVVIDSPGIRELAPVLEEDDLAETFADIEAVAANCRFRDCQHDREPGCEVRIARQDGTLDHDRVSNYLLLRKQTTSRLGGRPTRRN